MDCKLIKHKRDEESYFLYVEGSEFSILQIIEDDVFYIPDSVKKCKLKKGETGYNLVYVDNHGFNVTFDGIDRKKLNAVDLLNFIATHGSYEIVIKLNSYFQQKE